MAYEPISGLPPQFSALADGTSASDYYLKFYAADGTTPINMATDTTGGTLLAKCKINSTGYTVNVSNAVFIPHIDQEYKLALYPSEALADANTLASATWVVDDIPTRTSLASTIIPFATVAAAQAATGLASGMTICIAARASSLWDLSSSGSANGWDVIYLTASNLYATLRTDGIVNLKAFGCAADGVTEDQAVIQAAIIYAIANQYPVYAPSGTYIVGSVATTYDIRCTLTASGQSFKLYGDGATTVFKEKDGKNASVGRYTRMFFCYLDAANIDVGDIVFKDFKIDKNGRSNGTPASLYLWEQSHAISILDTDGSSSVDNIIFDNVIVDDRTGAGIYVGGQVTARSISVNNCHDGDNFQEGVIGKRGMFEINANCENVSYDRSTADYMQIELVTADTKTADKQLIAKVNNCQIDTIEWTADSIDGRDYTWLHLNNSTVKTSLLPGNTSVKVNNSTIQLPSDIFPAEMAVSSSTVLFDTADGTSIVPIYVRDLGAFNKKVIFDDVSFKINYSGSVTATEFAFFSNATTATPEDVEVTVQNSRFDARFAHICDAYRSNVYRFYNNKLACTGFAFRVGGASSLIGKLYLKGNDYTDVGGAAVQIANSTAGWILEMAEIGKDGDLYIDSSSTSLSTVTATLMPIRPTIQAAAAPTTQGWVEGTIAWNNAPVAGSPIGWMCSVNGTSGGTWVALANL